MKPLRIPVALLTALGVLSASPAGAEDKIKTLIIDGQNNHRWQETTPVLKAILESCGRFEVSVATSPANAEEGLAEWAPPFGEYGVVVSNYNGALWGPAAQEAFEKYVDKGGGFVAVHAANNAFPKWEEYNKMIGIGGWGGRNEKSGPYLRWRDGKLYRVTGPGRGGSHGPRHEFLIVTRDPAHPIMKGLPLKWMHAQDELYDSLRGPAANIVVLGTAFSSKGNKGTGENEPMLMALDYGEGRVFHTTLGHDVKAMRGAGFQETLKRGTEWAATGEVTAPAVGSDVLPEDRVVYRDPAE